MDVQDNIDQFKRVIGHPDVEACVLKCVFDDGVITSDVELEFGTTARSIFVT